jgi:hypothetical protein
MKKVILGVAVLVFILGANLQAQQLAFPGAEGCAAYVTGGRGGDVYHVTNLADFNDYKGANETPIPGSLRYGLRTATGPRTIVFDVSGYIDLKARLEFGNHNITIAGQTAPGDGITLRHWDVRLYQTDNAIIRFIRVRPGHFTDQEALIAYSKLHPEDPNHLNGGLDCMSIEGSTNTIIDHCSLSWSADEIGSVTGDSNDITVQWTFLTEPLNWDGHAYISLMRPAKSGRFTHHHNLYTDCIQRLTRFGNWNDYVLCRFDWVNNVAYNWGNTTASSSYKACYNQDSTGYWNYDEREGGSTGGIDGELINVNFIKNYFIPYTSDAPTFFTGYQTTPYGKADDSKIWAESNYWNGSDPGQWAKLSGIYAKMSSAFPLNGPLKIDEPNTAYNRVLAYGGNWLVRDGADTRIVNEVITRTGAGSGSGGPGILSTQNDTGVGGFPTLSEVNRPAGFDTDGDSMPDAWETARGLDPDDPNDRNIVRFDGYTNLERYLNYLVLWRGPLKGDINNDSKVDYEDLAAFLEDWLVEDHTFAPSGDLNGDGYEDFYDFAIFAQNWTE